MPAGSGDQRELAARLRAVIEAKDTENAVLRAELQAQRERYRRLELRAAELERRLGSDSTTSGTPPSKDLIGARQRRKAERKARQSSERERRKDRKPGGQPGHPGAGLSRDPDPGERIQAPPPAECSRCGTGLEDARRAGTWWSQVRDVKITTFVTEYLLPLLACPSCGKINAAQPPPWAHPGSISYGPGINTAAVLLTCYGNVPAERAANPADSRWLAACFERGAVTSCFVATPEFRIIRLHTRYRRDLTEERTREKQRAEKLLESARSRSPRSLLTCTG